MARRAAARVQKQKLLLSRHLMRCSVLRPGRLPFNPSARFESPKPLLGDHKGCLAQVRLRSNAANIARSSQSPQTEMDESDECYGVGPGYVSDPGQPKTASLVGASEFEGLPFCPCCGARLSRKGATSDQRRPCRMRARFWRAPPRCRRSLGRECGRCLIHPKVVQSYSDGNRVFSIF